MIDVKARSMLLIKSNHGIWSHPKGSPNPSPKRIESRAQTASRELREETGIIISRKAIKDLPSCRVGHGHMFILRTKQSKWTNFKPKDAFEVKEVSWKTIDEIDQLDANEIVKTSVILFKKNKLFTSKYNTNNVSTKNDKELDHDQGRFAILNSVN
jgi:ADP-ribose pyrophosphatase YjhB (NUDIX family)